MAHSVVAGDPSLRLKNGYAQDDAIDERRCHQKFKLHRCFVSCDSEPSSSFCYQIVVRETENRQLLLLFWPRQRNLWSLIGRMAVEKLAGQPSVVGSGEGRD